jgi:hypothetical protein
MADRLVDRIADRVSRLGRRPRNFFERLPPEAQVELEDVRRRFQSGELQTSASALADLLIEESAADGIQLCGHQGLRVWLTRND